MRLLHAFEEVFSGHQYKHRSSSIGDRLSAQVIEDLYVLGRSRALVDGVDRQTLVLNTKNRITGRAIRRGDGTFGERLVSVAPKQKSGFNVARGPTADVQIGIEVKILATAMIKQIDRVISDLRKQAGQFTGVTPQAITLGIVGINHATVYRSYEGERYYDKPGEAGPAPAREAAAAAARLEDGTSGARSAFDEFLILDFRAENKPPFTFSWVDEQATRNAYAAALQRISRAYERRFG